MSQAPVSDDVLLRAFVFERDAGAFDQLARRHAGMVLGVCQAVLGNGADAEDAAQAVFLTLLTKARSLVNHPTLGGWLHHVAWHVAVRSRRTRANRARYEREAAQMNANIAGDGSSVPADLLHEALMGLPDRYRLPLVLHHIEGYTQEEAARILDCKVGTVSGRLTRGRHLLAGRLRKLGVTAGVAAVAGALASATASAAPAGLMAAINTMATSALAGQVAGASASAMALSKGAIHMMFMAKLKLAALVTAAVMLVGGAGVGTYLAAAYGAAAPKADTVGPPAAGVGLALPAATKPAAPGLTLALYSDGRSFPDGKIWKLGAQGMGRPFAVRLILTNGGKDALRIWDPDGSEGSTSLGFVLTDATGRETILRTPAKARLTGLPTVWKFGGSDAPYGERARDVTVDLLQVIGERSLPPGKYRIRAFMQNAVENDGAFIKEPVWTGRIESEPTEIEISDKPATQPAAVDEARALELARGAAEEAVKGSYAAHVAAVKARGHVSPEHPDPWLSNVAPRVGRIGNGWRFEWQRTPMAGFGCQAVVEVTATGQVQVQIAKAWFSGK